MLSSNTIILNYSIWSALFFRSIWPKEVKNDDHLFVFSLFLSQTQPLIRSDPILSDQNVQMLVDLVQFTNSIAFLHQICLLGLTNKRAEQNEAADSHRYI